LKEGGEKKGDVELTRVGSEGIDKNSGKKKIKSVPYLIEGEKSIGERQHES